MEKAARPLGVRLQVHDVRTADDIAAAFDAGARWRAEGALVTTESMFIVHRARVTELAARDLDINLRTAKALGLTIPANTSFPSDPGDRVRQVRP